jgi:predicted RNase H-like HicB family nuclease
MFVAIVPTLPGAHTQAATLDELERNVREVVELCLEEAESRGLTEFPSFYGVHELELER